MEFNGRFPAAKLHMMGNELREGYILEEIFVALNQSVGRVLPFTKMKITDKQVIEFFFFFENSKMRLNLGCKKI